VTAFVHTDFDRSYATTYPSKVFGRWLGRRIGAMAGWYTRSVLSKCDAVYCLAPSFQDHLRGLGIPNVTVIPLGVDTDVFSPARRDLALRDQLGVPDDGVMVVYAGRLDSEKRTDIMVAAAELAHQKHPLLLVLAGTGPNRALLEEQEAAGLPIRVLDYVSDPLELARLLASADLYLTAGPFETFGLSVVEAQACGLPVVGVQAGALIERVRPEFGFLGPVDDSGIMATHILAAAGARDSLGEAARKHVVTNLSWTHTFQSLFESYCTLIKNT
jgi:alpha-1,6-mannosyltransferase